MTAFLITAYIIIAVVIFFIGFTAGAIQQLTVQAKEGRQRIFEIENKIQELETQYNNLSKE